MGPTLDEPQSFGQGSYFGRSWEYGGLYGIRSSRRNDWNDSQPERRHGQSLGRIKSELLVETDLKDVSIISFHGPGSHVVIKAHQQSTVNSFTRSRSDFLKPLPSSALAESPNVSQIHSEGHFCTIIRALRSL